jgi:hypothetical protein
MTVTLAQRFKPFEAEPQKQDQTASPQPAETD